MKLKACDRGAAISCMSANWSSAIFLAAFLTIISASAAVPPPSAEELNAAEKCVVERVTAGEVADLSKEFPEEKDRHLSADFLQNLMMGTLPNVKLHRHGVRIIGATIDESIDLANAQIPCEVRLSHCQFNKSVTFSSASFAANASFDHSTFKANAKFTLMKVGGSDASFNAAVFEGPVYFIRADIAGNFEAIGAKFQDNEIGAIFSSMKVRGDALFDFAEFKGLVYFFGADIAGKFTAPRAKFQNKEKYASFNRIKVGSEASFDGAEFEGPVYFFGADIADKFTAQRAKFQNKELGAHFGGMKVVGDALFNAAAFEGPVVFSGADIANKFEVQSSKFEDNKLGAIFSGMKVRGDALFNAAVFEGRVDLVGADIANNFQAVGAKFQNKEKYASFNRMKVGGEAYFDRAVFEGPVNFIGADIGSDFRAKGARFTNKEKKVNFSRMKVRDSAFFNDALFEGPVDFGYTDFGLLDVSRASWPKDPAQFQMQGMSYKTIRAAPGEPKSHKALANLANQSAYTADVYSRLEEFFLRQGYRADADEAFIAGKVRERQEYFRRGDWLGWLRSWMLDLLVGYGRKPWRAGIPCAVLVALGCVLFSPKKMEPQNPEDTPRVYNRFWYSLGLFLPFVDLQADKVWKPKADQIFLRNYMRVHILLGWILVPLVLAAVTGLIK